jgi:hypothetical protein
MGMKLNSPDFLRPWRIFFLFYVRCWSSSSSLCMLNIDRANMLAYMSTQLIKVTSNLSHRSHCRFPWWNIWPSPSIAFNCRLLVLLLHTYSSAIYFNFILRRYQSFCFHLLEHPSTCIAKGSWGKLAGALSAATVCSGLLFLSISKYPTWKDVQTGPICKEKKKIYLSPHTQLAWLSIQFWKSCFSPSLSARPA